MFFIITDEWRRRNCCEAVSSITEYGKYSVEIKPYKKNRSKAQNRLMWQMYNAIDIQTSTPADEIHEQMKVSVLGVDKRIVSGQPLIIPKSTTNLNTKEMTHFLQAIEALAKDLGVRLPTNDEYNYAMGVK